MQDDSQKDEAMLFEPVLGSRACSHCGNDLREEELESPFTDDNDDALCDECYHDLYEQTCPICEDYFEKPTKPEETFFVVSKEAEEACGVKAGFYQVTSYPYWLGATGFGFERLFEDSIKLIRACNINSMLKKLHGGSDIGADECCPTCVERFTARKYRHTKYVDPTYRIHHNIYERGVIEHGA